MPDRLRIDDQAAVVGADQAGDIDHAGIAMHPYLDNERNIGALELPVGKTAADGDVGIGLIAARRGTRVPAVLLGGGTEQLVLALLLEIAQAELDRVASGRGRHLVEESLAPEH